MCIIIKKVSFSTDVQIFSILEVLIFLYRVEYYETTNFMNAEEKLLVRKELESKFGKLNRDIVDLKELTRPESPDSAIGRVSRMDAINNRSVNEATLRKKKIQFSKIQIALIEIDKPDFGSCKRCGKTIQKERIMLMPESKFCVNCAG